MIINYLKIIEVLQPTKVFVLTSQCLRYSLDFNLLLTLFFSIFDPQNF